LIFEPKGFFVVLSEAEVLCDKEKEAFPPLFRVLGRVKKLEFLEISGLAENINML